MKSKFIYSGMPKKLIASIEGDLILIRAIAAVFAIGKTLRAHIIMDRGLGGDNAGVWHKAIANRKVSYFSKIWQVLLSFLYLLNLYLLSGDEREVDWIVALAS